MQREIKFRAWSKENNRMYYFGLLELDGHWNYAESEMMPQDIQIMQFTGLKDRNGKEIYEGDIIQYENFNGEKFRKFVVVWDYFGWLPWTDLQPELSPFRGTEVVGNQYENPELLAPTIEK